MKRFITPLLSILGGLLLAFAWYPHGLPFLIFFAWIPFFFMSDALLEKNGRAQFVKGWLYSWAGFMLWNFITTYWIGYCTVPGAIGAIVANSMLQAWVFGFWHCCRKHVRQEWVHPILLIAFWISFEYLHLNWDLTWPWLNLGNVFAVCPQWVQWYAITGAAGGTLWVLLLNFLLYYLIRHISRNHRVSWGLVATGALVFVIPVIISGVIYQGAKRAIDQSTPVDVVAVQQNTDPWEEEYELTNEQQIRRLIDVATPHIDERTALVVCPESSVPHNISLLMLQTHNFPTENKAYSGFSLLDSVISLHPNLNFILGMSLFSLYDHPASLTARPVGEGMYVDVFNSALCYGKNHYNGHYHKCRLVPGVEKMPFPKLLGFLGDAFIKLGGSNTSLGVDSAQRTFVIQSGGRNLRVGTAICYESIYGELFGQFVRNGANLMTVITNDSWWADSQGHKQHFEMSRLRAVETRRYVVRAANGGFSGIIDPCGNVLQKTNYDERTALKATVYAQQGETFYVRHGDYIARIAVAIALLGFLFALGCWCKQKAQSSQKKMKTEN